MLPCSIRLMLYWVDKSLALRRKTGLPLSSRIFSAELYPRKHQVLLEIFSSTVSLSRPLAFATASYWTGRPWCPIIECIFWAGLDRSSQKIVENFGETIFFSGLSFIKQGSVCESRFYEGYLVLKVGVRRIYVGEFQREREKFSYENSINLVPVR